MRGPLLDNLYARLQRCGNLACAGKPFTEHWHVPDLRVRRAGPPKARARHGSAGLGAAQWRRLDPKERLNSATQRGESRPTRGLRGRNSEECL